MAVVTVMVVWSECVFFIKSPVLSLFAIFLNVATTRVYNYIAIEASHSGELMTLTVTLKILFHFLVSTIGGEGLMFRVCCPAVLAHVAVHEHLFHMMPYFFTLWAELIETCHK